jgi:hypothetical protein
MEDPRHHLSERLTFSTVVAVGRKHLDDDSRHRHQGLRLADCFGAALDCIVALPLGGHDVRGRDKKSKMLELLECAIGAHQTQTSSGRRLRVVETYAAVSW